MTGFRVGLTSAQGHYARLLPGFEPDLSVFGKVIGGGMPLAPWRQARGDEAPGTARGRLPGRHPVRQPGGHRLRLATLREISRPASLTPCRPRRASSSRA